MKLKKIYIKNLASITEAEIDFTTTSLKDAPLFIISGETGSGKTTITDAVCLSFYGRTPRLTSGKSEKISELDQNSKEGLSVFDSRNFMRKGTTEAMADTYFQGDDGVEYMARWSVSRSYNKADGNLKNVDNKVFYLVNGEYVEKTRTKKEWEDLIPEITGYDYDRFVKCVLLAQNQFSKFLNANADEKTDILQMLTDTSIYETISKTIFERFRLEKQKLEALKIDREKILLLTDEQILQINNQISECYNVENQLKQQIDNINKDIQQFNVYDGLKKDVDQKHQNFNRATQDSKNAEPLRTEIAGIKIAVEKFKSPIDALTVSINQNKKIEKEYRETQSEAQKIVDGVKKLNDNVLALTSDLQENKNKFSALEKNANVYENIKMVSSKIDNLINLDKNIADISSKISEQETLKQKETSQLKIETQQKEEFTVEYNNLNNKLLSEKQKIFNIDINALNNKKDELSTKINNLDGALKILQIIKNYQTDIDNLNANCAEKEKKYNQTIAEKELKSKQLETVTAEYSAVNDLFMRQQKISSQDLKKERLKLKTGEECPLCGSKEHPFCDNGELIVDQMLQTAKKNLDEKLNQKTSLEADIKSSEIVCKTLKTDIDKIKTSQLPEKVSQLNEQLARVEKIRNYFNFPDQCDLPKKIQETKDDCNLQKENVTEQINFYHKIDLSVKDIQKQADTSKDKLQKITLKIADTEAKITNASALITEKQSTLQKTSTEKQSAIADLKEFLPVDVSLDGNLPSLKLKLENDAKNYTVLKENITLITNNLQKLDGIKKQCGDVSRVKSFYPDLKTANSSAFNDNLETLPVKIAKTIEIASHKNAEINRLKNEINIGEKKIQQLINEENSVNVALELSLEKIKKYLAYSDEERKEKLLRLDKIDKDLIAAQADYNTSIQKFETFENENANLLTSKTLETLQAECQAAEKNRTSNIEQRTKLLQQLTDNDAKKSETQKLDEKIKSQQSVFDDWNFLYDKFGSSDGKKLKKYAQSFTLKILLENANYRLKKILPRYSLYAPDGLTDILVTDRDENALRPVSTVSGGESFMLSLVLALGLSDMMQAGKGSDTLFVDEGFGTLDSANLHKVISMLEKLHVQGRRVGIISHVKELQERIPSKIIVEKCPGDNTKSVVSVV